MRLILNGENGRALRFGNVARDGNLLGLGLIAESGLDLLHRITDGIKHDTRHDR